MLSAEMVMTQTGHMSFDYPISECDVRESERPRLERFRERFSVWQEWLSKDEHSIWGQIHGMLWNDMVLRTVNECRRLAHKNPSPHVAFNGAVISFIDEGYAAKRHCHINWAGRKMRWILNWLDAPTLL